MHSRQQSEDVYMNENDNVTYRCEPLSPDTPSSNSKKLQITTLTQDNEDIVKKKDKFKLIISVVVALFFIVMLVLFGLQANWSFVNNNQNIELKEKIEREMRTSEKNHLDMIHELNEKIERTMNTSEKNLVNTIQDVYTCHHLVIRDGITESGFYEVGKPGNRYKVYCNLFMGAAVTEIWHNSMIEIQATRCTGSACYSHRPQYNIAMDKIAQITNHSKHCQQYIKYRCQDSALLYNVSPLYGYWSSRDGEKMKYWGGASSKRPGYCACGETGTCDDKQTKCNCDKNGPPMTQDEGYLTDRSKLPVTEMRFGDIDDTNEFGWHTLGMLQCTGSV